MLWTLLSLAMAQDSPANFDAYGLRPVPTYGELRDSIATWRPASPLGGSRSLHLLFSYVDEPLVLYGSQGSREALLDNVAGANVLGLFSLGRRLAVGVDVPVYLPALSSDSVGGDVTMGDARLSVPVGLVIPPGEGGFSLALVPFVDAPTGDAAQYLGSDNFSGGGLLALGVALPGWQLTGNVGSEFNPDVRLLNLEGASALLASGAVTRLLGAHHGLSLEAQARPIYEGSTIEGAAFPVEGVLSFRGHYDGGLGWALGGGTALSEGASAAAYRAFVGLGWSQVRYEPPPVPASLAITVVDENGQPLPGAAIAVEGQSVAANAEGVASRSGMEAGEELTVTASLAGYAPAAPREVSLLEGRNAVTLTLSSLPAGLTIVVVGPDGQPLDAQVRLDGPAQVTPLAMGSDGTETAQLRHGAWRVVAMADGYAPAREAVELERGEQETLRVQLAATKVKVTEKEMIILEPVFFDFDRDTIKSESFALLNEIAAILAVRPDIRKIEVQGHTDSQGKDAYNLDLSQRRAAAVVRYLVEHGVEASRLTSTGYGESRPIAKGKNEAAHAQNRRVQFIILDPVPAGNGASNPTTQD